jgi:hypothetical protein
MLGILLGWFGHKLWNRYKIRKNPPHVIVRADGIYEGKITYSSMVAGPMTTECELSDPDPVTGQREVLSYGEKIPQGVGHVATMRDRDEGRLTIRFEGGDCTAREAMAKADIGDVWRMELYLVSPADKREPVESSSHYSYSPFGQPPGQGGVS